MTENINHFLGINTNGRIDHFQLLTLQSDEREYISLQLNRKCF